MRRTRLPDTSCLCSNALLAVNGLPNCATASACAGVNSGTSETSGSPSETHSANTSTPAIVFVYCGRRGVPARLSVSERKDSRRLTISGSPCPERSAACRISGRTGQPDVCVLTSINCDDPPSSYRNRLPVSNVSTCRSHGAAGCFDCPLGGIFRLPRRVSPVRTTEPKTIIAASAGEGRKSLSLSLSSWNGRIAGLRGSTGRLRSNGCELRNKDRYTDSYQTERRAASCFFRTAA
jgi:hypothetical protein